MSKLFHARATHIDATGMPVAFNSTGAYHPSPCCGATAKGLGGYVGCRKCYSPIPVEFGGVPVAPITPRTVTVGEVARIFAAIDADPDLRDKFYSMDWEQMQEEFLNNDEGGTA